MSAKLIASGEKSKKCVLPKRYQGKSGNLTDARDNQENIRDIVCLCLFWK